MPPGYDSVCTFVTRYHDWDGNCAAPTFEKEIIVGVGSTGKEVPLWKGHLTAGQWVGAIKEESQ